MKTPLGESILKEVINKIKQFPTKKPLIVGLSGPQGSGKSTAVEFVGSQLSEKLDKKVVYFSLDDVYLTHEKQQQLKNDSNNPLLAKRGLPGTHDVSLCHDIINCLKKQLPCHVPVYDKSAFDGLGDRAAQQTHLIPPYDIVLFEGWCVGFESLSDKDLEQLYEASCKGTPRAFRYNHAYAVDTGTDKNNVDIIEPTYIKKYAFDHLKYVNEQLKLYETSIWANFDVFIQIDTVDLNYVYQWRLQQEHHLITLKGRGMTDEQVKLFVDSYMPAYELYFGKLRRRQGTHFVLDRNRDLIATTTLTETV